MNKKTKALTTEQYKDIIQTMREGFCGCRPNERIATALVLEGNLGLRISDILKLRLSDVVRDGDRFRLEVVETLRCDMTMLSEEDTFICGFQLGARLMLDIIGDHCGQFRTDLAGQ